MQTERRICRRSCRVLDQHVHADDQQTEGGGQHHAATGVVEHAES